MKPKFFKILIVMAVLAMPFALAGCQKKCPTPAKNIPGTSTFRQDCPIQDATVGSSGKKELNFYFVYDNTDAFKQQIQAFQSQNPNVLIRTKKFVNLQEYHDTIVNEIAEGAGPDVFMIHNTWITKDWKKLLPMPLNLPVTMTPDQYRQTYFQAAASDLIINDKIYGVPLAMDNLALYYNKAYFRDLLATTDRPGDLWELIKDEVFQLTKRNNSPERFALAGIAFGRADNVVRAVDVLYTMMLQYGVKFYDDKEESATFAESGSANAQGIDNPGEQAMTLYTSFGLPTYKNYSWNDTITGYDGDLMEAGTFVRGKVAMIAGYPYLYDTLVQGIQNQQRNGAEHIDINDIGIAPMPQLVSGTEATKRDTLASYYPLVVSRTTQDPTDAWMFAQFLTNADSLQTYHKVTNRPTSRMDMVTDQETDPLFGVFAYQAPFAKSFKIYDEDAYNKVFTDAIQKVATNVSSPKEALNEAQDKITCIVKKQKGILGEDQDCGI
jgi:ABC-type glycerol-3-phosphate transport system substrate-binding protein